MKWILMLSAWSEFRAEPVLFHVGCAAFSCSRNTDKLPPQTEPISARMDLVGRKSVTKNIEDSYLQVSVLVKRKSVILVSCFSFDCIPKSLYCSKRNIHFNRYSVSPTFLTVSFVASNQRWASPLLRYLSLLLRYQVRYSTTWLSNW